MLLLLLFLPLLLPLLSPLLPVLLVLLLSPLLPLLLLPWLLLLLPLLPVPSLGSATTKTANQWLPSERIVLHTAILTDAPSGGISPAWGRVSKDPTE